MSAVGFLKYPDTRLASSLPPSGFCIDKLQQMVMLFAFCVRVPGIRKEGFCEWQSSSPMRDSNGGGFADE